MSAAADFFAENGSLARPMAPDQVIQGRETIRAALLTRPKTLLTKHLATNVMIDVVSRDEARGLSYLTMISTTPPGDAAAPYVSAGPVYFGEFADRFVREGGEWKILERRGSIQMKFFGARCRLIRPALATRTPYPRSLAQERQRRRQLGQQFLAEPCIDVEERRAGDRARAILPGVVRTPLHDHVPRLQDHFAVIENQHELALDHDHIVQRPRPMHHGSLAAVLERIDVQDPQQVARRRA